ncbi:hypothetical protein [Pseudomonas sp. R9.37]|uniref:hypothetical protein n=1 Tax=Pseudomonas sp. R9.37 TaxID=1390498 RepID=UPI000D0D3419|nr:hypothetical protein [Pseudomonas sp. R9.37]PSL90759.1 hypothetical protein C7U57_28480 [Pseudomonas sp. R9.37]
MKIRYMTCRTCNAALPEKSSQGDQWHRDCAECYPKNALPTSVNDAREIAVHFEDRSLRVFPHISNDGLLAMRLLPNMQSYVLMANGDIRMRPNDFVMPEGLPIQLMADIERSFILTDRRVAEAKRAFEAYAANDFEVID